MDSREKMKMNVGASGADSVETREPKLLLTYKTAIWAFSEGTK
jgi:hypothetical protein